MDHHHHWSPRSMLSFPLIRREMAYNISSLLILLLLLFVLDVAISSHHRASLLRLAFPSNIQHSQWSRPPAGECDYLDGRWIWDENYRKESYSEECQFLDPGFQCRRNGRNDTGYLNWRWQPHGCDLPRFNASNMLEKYRNGRIVFVGDSIGRNQWESLVCMLAKSVRNQSTIYEQNGNPITKHKGFLLIRFHSYNLTVEYYRSPFFVTIGRPPPDSSNGVNKAIRIDELQWVSERWAGADVYVFNSGHWWNYDKTRKMGFYFQEGKALNMSIDAKEGLRRSLETLKQWIASNPRMERSHVFFRSYSPTHYSGGTWAEGGTCHSNTKPETNLTAADRAEPWNNELTSEMAERMRKDGKRDVQFMNITYLTDLRKDGHPSSHREPGTPPLSPEDCSHWCLPGVPDTWNELLFAYLLSKDSNTSRKQWF